MAEYFKAECKRHNLTVWNCTPKGMKYCLKCHREKQRRYEQSSKKERARNRKTTINAKRRNQDYVLSRKKDGCTVCGYKKCAGALHFHHYRKEKKDTGISRLVKSCSTIQRIEYEISKCVLLCANCHAEVHAGLIQLTEEK